MHEGTPTTETDEPTLATSNTAGNYLHDGDYVHDGRLPPRCPITRVLFSIFHTVEIHTT